MVSWFLLFVALMVVAVVVLQNPSSEPMTCSRPLYGPRDTRPGLYGPGDGPFVPGKPESKHPGCRVRNDQPIDDDGKCSSDSSSRNPNCLPTYSYSPSLDLAFPTEGPPEPYLNDFDKIRR
jgi:hypothetical protein